MSSFFGYMHPFSLPGAVARVDVLADAINAKSV